MFFFSERVNKGASIMDENDFHYYHDQDDENPDVNEYEDNQMLNHITHDTLHVSCYLSDDAFTGET